MQTAKVIAVLALAPILALAPVGCNASPAIAQNARLDRLTRSQKYDLDEVLRRSSDLNVGMTKPNVLIQLGSPAVNEGERWYYLPDESPPLIPPNSFYVTFERGVLKSWGRQAYELD